MSIGKNTNIKNSLKPEVENKEERDDSFLDQTLRPSRWDEYIGQQNIKENLRILLTAAKERNHPPEHLLFYGPPGLGKTTLAYLIAKETGAQIKVTSGPAIEKVGDLASILTNLLPGDILFIDEIHRLNKTIEEVLYSAMEDYAENYDVFNFYAKYNISQSLAEDVSDHYPVWAEFYTDKDTD